MSVYPPPPPRAAAAAAARGLLARVCRSIVALHGRPEQIALGAAIGVFVALTPTVGFQMILAAVIATWCRASRPAAVIPVWITNPLTIAPIYALTYQFGRLFVPGPDAWSVYGQFTELGRRLATRSVWEMWDRSSEVLALGGEVLVPLVLGSIIAGLIAGGLTYPIVLAMVRSYRKLESATASAPSVTPAAAR